MFALRLFLIAIPVLWSTSCFCQTGPGGVGTDDGTSTLIYWIDAERGRTGTAPVTALLDQSGYNVTNTINGNLSFVENTLNTHGVLRFDRDNGDEIATNLTINADARPYITIYAVYTPAVALAGSVWGEDNGSWDRFMTDINLTSTLIASVGAGYDHGASNPPCYNIPNLFTVGVPTLTSVIYREDDLNDTHVRVNGTTELMFTSTANNYGGGLNDGYSNFYVGAIGSSGWRFEGDIAEVIVFDDDLLTVEQLIVENHLSAKYGIPLATGVDVYRGDDVGFDYEVAGIGMTAGLSHTNSRGTGRVRIWNANNLNANEFLMWGHDNGPLTTTSTGLPAGIASRSNRTWFASERNLAGAVIDVGQVSVSFNLTGLGPVTATDLRLLVDTNADGSFADETPITNAVSLGSGEYGFHNVSAIADGRRFTISTINANQTPLPVELLTFQATAHHDQNAVTLSWTTALEKNNDHFEISRSRNANEWTVLGAVTGAGNSMVNKDYTFVDRNALEGQSYYRLQQFDFDGTATLSDIRAVRIDQPVVLSVFPNPAKSKVIISGSENILPIRVFSLTGLDYTDQVNTDLLPDGTVELDTEPLPEGDYIIISPAGRTKMAKTGN